MCLCILFGLIVFASHAQESVSIVTNAPFKVALQSETFVDHSNFIKEIYRYKRILITAPEGYGKSTNLDMVKRFAEIKVDNIGKPVQAKTTQNYALFKVYNLNIYKDTPFFEQYFGKNPVIYIDYSNLDPTSEESLITSYKKIQNATFWPHRYLFKNKKLWVNEGELESFRRFTETEIDENDIHLGFIFLIRVLHDHFKAKVVVLIDEFDSYLSSPSLKDNPDRKNIIYFVNTINEEFLTLNPFLERAIVTGQVTNVKPSCEKITAMTFLDDPFNKYYGMSEDEIESLFKKINDVKKKETMEKLRHDDKVERHTSDIQKKTLYSISDVLSFVKNIK